MNEKMNQIIDEAHRHYLEETMFSSDPTWLEPVKCINTATGEISTGARQYSRESFVSKIKSDSSFSNYWRLKIEERELDMMERWAMADLTPNMTEFDYCNKLCDEYNVPTKLITITYKEEKFEFYEN